MQTILKSVLSPAKPLHVRRAEVVSVSTSSAQVKFQGRTVRAVCDPALPVRLAPGAVVTVAVDPDNPDNHVLMGLLPGKPCASGGLVAV